MDDRFFERVERIPQPLRFMVKLALGVVIFAAAVVLFDVLLPLVAIYGLLAIVAVGILGCLAYWPVRLIRRFRARRVSARHV